MAEEKGYQGWTNYETWAMALWLDNDEGLYREMHDLARRTLIDVETDPDFKGRRTKKKVAEAAMYILADTMKDMLDEMRPDLGASVWSDLLNGAFSEINWFEIARHYLEK